MNSTRFPEFATSPNLANTASSKRHGVKPFDWYLERRGWPERTAAFLEGARRCRRCRAESPASAQLGAANRYCRDRLLTGIAASLEARVARDGFAPTSLRSRCRPWMRGAFRPIRRSRLRKARRTTCCGRDRALKRTPATLTRESKPIAGERASRVGVRFRWSKRSRRRCRRAKLRARERFRATSTNSASAPPEMPRSAPASRAARGYSRTASRRDV